MKVYVFLFFGLLISISAVGGILFTDTTENNRRAPYDIETEMEKRFAIRDTFKEKGNSGKYLKVSHLQP